MKRSTVAVLIAAGAAMLPAQTLTPRQLFYSSDAPPKPQAAPPAATAPKTAPRKKAVVKKAQPPKAAPAEVPVQPVEAEVAAPSTAPVMVTAATYTTGQPQAQSPLGLRYALIRVVDGVEHEAGPNDVFHSGDMVRVKVEGNRDGFLYVVARGSSGNWKPLFPAPEINGGLNRVSAHRGYDLPSASQAFTFDEQAGQEQLFIVYSTEPVHDMEQMIPSLSSPGKPAAPMPEAVIASAAPMNDEFVSRLRNTYSRDLIVQTVTPKQPAESAQEKPENAVYVVNQIGGRVVADIRLEHR